MSRRNDYRTGAEPRSALRALGDISGGPAQRLSYECALSLQSMPGSRETSPRSFADRVAAARFLGCACRSLGPEEML
jgi:hypothetical protein